MTLDPGELTATVDIRGHAPVLLTAADGRVSQFPRAWATVTTADGRTGVGWVEWNRNQPMTASVRQHHHDPQPAASGRPEMPSTRGVSVYRHGHSR